MPDTKYPDSMVARAKRLHDGGMQWADVAAAVGHKDASGDGVRRIVKSRWTPAIDAAYPEDGQVAEITGIEYLDKRQPDKIDWRAGINAMESERRFRSGQNISQASAKVKINTTKPIAIICMEDLHLGDVATDYKAIERDVDLILNNDQLYVFKGGDITDNFNPKFRDARAVMHQVTPPQMQKIIASKLMDALGRKIVAAWAGNHDAMDAKQTGIDTEYFIHHGRKFPYMAHGGRITLTVGKVDYIVFAKHSYRFQSSLNQFNSHHRMRDILDPHGDVYIQGHTHNPGIEVLHCYTGEARKQVINVRAGTYKHADGFSMEWYKEGVSGPQALVFFPDRRKVVPFDGPDAIDLAITFMRGVTVCRSAR